MRFQLACLLALVAASAAGQTPPPSPGTGLILGRVVDGTSGRPLGDVTVTLTPPAQGPGATSSRVLTSGDGYFLFAGLPRGGYSIAASKGGYVPGAQGKLHPSGSGQPLDLTDGGRLTDVTIPMWRYASVSGTVVDEAGEPLVGVQVRLLRRSIVAGAWRLTLASTEATDDRGVYRAAQLVPEGGDHGIALLRPVQPDVGDAVLHLEVEGREGHGDSPKERGRAVAAVPRPDARIMSRPEAIDERAGRPRS